MRKLLGDTGYEWDHEDSSKAVHHLNSHDPRATAHLLQASQVFFRFRMLDIYAQVMGIGGGSPRVLCRLRRPPASVRRLDQVRHSILVLSGYLPFISFTNIFKTGTNCFTTSLPSTIDTLLVHLSRTVLEVLQALQSVAKSSSGSCPAFSV
jgi:hypothetical protein